MAKKKTITVQGVTVSFFEKEKEKEEYFSLTDIARKFNEDTPSSLIVNWMRNRDTIEYLGVWEQLNNENFNPIEFDKIKNEAGTNRFVLSIKRWVNETGAVGIYSTPGKYGGTFAHRDLAVNFCYWLSPTFQLYLIKEFQRLKADEAQRLNSDWNLKRQLAKANWHIHTEAVREYLVPMIDWNTKREAIYQASEADLLNLALFGMTAREWQQANPDKTGNIRDHASTEQLLVLANLQALNAKLIEWDSPKEQRIEILHKTAREQMEILVRSRAIGNIKKLEDSGKRGDSPLKIE